VTASLAHVVQQAAFGAIAAAGFGVLFNFRYRRLGWCALAGALALAVRTACQDLGWNLEAASLAAAVIVTTTAVGLLRTPLGTMGGAVAVAGCIPMVPGAFFAQGILALFAVTVPQPQNAEATMIMAMEYMVRVIFTVCAIGAGIAIPSHILRVRDF
jgi:uncharacterized membrane protein YjjB (DUF3815 family)